MKRFAYIYSMQGYNKRKLYILNMQITISHYIKDYFDCYDIESVTSDIAKKYDIICIDHYAINELWTDIKTIEKNLEAIKQCQNVCLITRDLHNRTFLNGHDMLIYHQKCKKDSLQDENINGYVNLKLIMNKYNIRHIISIYNCAELNKITAITNCSPHILSLHIDTKIFKNLNITRDIDIFIYGADYKQVYPLRKRIKNIVKTMNIKYYILDPKTTYDAKCCDNGLAQLLNRSWLTLCTCSIYDYLVLKYFEASACGSVVIGNMATQGREIWQDNYINVPENSTDDDIKNIILNALSDRDKLREMSDTMSKKICSEYSYEKYTEKINNICINICENQKNNICTNICEKQIKTYNKYSNKIENMYKSKWPVFTEKMVDDVALVLRSGKVNQWTGTKVIDFQKKFAEYFNIKHAIAVFNGSVAIELCLKAIDLKPGDEVIVTPRTFIASASSVNVCGGTAIFVDVDPDSQNITLENIKSAVTIKTRAVILVHLAGWPCDVEEIVAWCHNNNIYVIEDCAQSHGAKYNGKYLGTFGDINAWSFCQDKIITTGGEGGMVTTNNDELFLKAWSYKDHGKNYNKMFGSEQAVPGKFRWLHDTIGTNFRMTEMQAVIGIDALDHLQEWIDIRRANANIFNEALRDLPLIRLTIPDKKYYHAYYKYYCFIRPENLQDGLTRDDIMKAINDTGIPCFQGTCGEVYREKAYDLDINLPITRRLTETSLMFLVDPTYIPDKIREITSKIRKILLGMTRISNFMDHNFAVNKYTNYAIKIKSPTAAVLNFRILQDYKYGIINVTNNQNFMIEYYNEENDSITIKTEVLNDNYKISIEKVETKIDQIYMNPILQITFMEDVQKMYGLKHYYNDYRPAIFYGLMNEKDIEQLERNKSLKVIVWVGGDVNHTINRTPELSKKLYNNIKRILRVPKIRHISISSFINRSLENLKVPYKMIPFMGADFSKYRAVKKGACIYLYTSPCSEEYYGSRFYTRLIKKYNNIKFIVTCCKVASRVLNKKNRKYGIKYYEKTELVEKIYPQCFIGLRLTDHDGLAGTVQELGLMGIKCVHNGASPSSLNYSTFEDICAHIDREMMTIGTIDYELADRVKKYLTIDNNFFDTDFYKDF